MRSPLPRRVLICNAFTGSQSKPQEVAPVFKADDASIEWVQSKLQLVSLSAWPNEAAHALHERSTAHAYMASSKVNSLRARMRHQQHAAHASLTLLHACAVAMQLHPLEGSPARNGIDDPREWLLSLWDDVQHHQITSQFLLSVKVGGGREGAVPLIEITDNCCLPRVSLQRAAGICQGGSGASAPSG